MSREKNNRKRHLLRCLIFVAVFVFIQSITVMAATDAETIAILKEFNMPKNNIVSYVCRWIGWAALCGLSYVVNGIEYVVYSVNSSIGNFFANAQIKNLNDNILTIIFLIFVLVVIFVGIQFIIQPRQQIAPIITNIVIGLVVLVTVPMMISGLYSLTNSAIDVLGQGNPTGIGTQVLLDNTNDVLRYDEDGFTTTNLGDKRSWYAENKSDAIVSIDITEMVKAENTSHPEIFGQKVEIAPNGKEGLSDIATTSVMWQDIPLLSERYYRWQVNWLVCFVSLIISAIALLLSSIRMAIALYELAIHGMLTEAMALLDVYTHQRMKKCLQLLVTTFASFFGFFLLMQVYLIGMSAITSSTNNVFVKIVCMIALGWMVIDGPHIFEKIIGQDLGLRSATGTLLGLKAAGAAIAGRRTFGGGRSGGLRGAIFGDKSLEPSGKVTHTGGLINKMRSSPASEPMPFNRGTPGAEKSARGTGSETKHANSTRNASSTRSRSSGSADMPGNTAKTAEARSEKENLASADGAATADKSGSTTVPVHTRKYNPAATQSTARKYAARPAAHQNRLEKAAEPAVRSAVHQEHLGEAAEPTARPTTHRDRLETMPQQTTKATVHRHDSRGKGLDRQPNKGRRTP